MNFTLTPAQDDPSVEPVYRAEVLRAIGRGLTAACAALPCCRVVDGWAAAYARPADSTDGRHYEVPFNERRFLVVQ